MKNKNHSDDNGLESDDQTYFREAMRGVRRLRSDKHAPQLKPRRNKALFFQDETTRHSPLESLSDEMHSEKVDGETRLFWAEQGVRNKTRNQLKKGLINYEEALDLHGMTIDEARENLSRFIMQAREQGVRCILIIHGKGYRTAMKDPVLKNKLNSWLKQHTDVIAFSSALPRDGGTGAVYVLLRKMHY